MGFRFSRRLRIAPGIRLNLSKSGVSTSIGGRGAWLTFGRRRTRATLSLPGTGLSYSESLGGPPPPSAHTGPALVAAPAAPAVPARADNALAPPRRRYRWLWWLLLVAIGVPLAWALFNV